MGYTTLSNLYFIVFGLSLIEEPHHRILVSFKFCLGILHIALVNLRQLWSGVDADILQSCYHIDRISYVDTAATEATRHEVVGADTKQRYCFQRTYRQCIVVFQQYHTLSATLSGDGSMSFEIGFATEFITFEAWCFHDILQHAAYIAIYISHIETAGFHRSHDIFHLSRVSRHHQIVAGSHLCFYGKVFALANPVGFYNTFIAPILAEHLGKEVFAALCIVSIHFVVSRHDGPRIAAAHHHLKSFQIEFSQCTWADALIHTGAVSFL